MGEEVWSSPRISGGDEEGIEEGGEDSKEREEVMPKQPYAQEKRPRAKHALRVVRVRGPKKGQSYVRYFSSSSKMQAYMKRNMAAGGSEKLLKYMDLSQKKAVKNSVLKDLKNWSLEGMGLGKMSREEKEYLTAFEEQMGRAPLPWEDPYLLERTGKFVDKAFTALTVAAGPGLALKGVKMMVQGTKLATQEAARAATKSALKKALNKTVKELTKKASVKNTLARAGKHSYKGGKHALHHEYEMSVAKEYKSMFKKGVNSVFK